MSYYDLDNIKSADPKSFSTLSAVYSKDKNQVYCNGEVLLGADSESFEVSSDSNQNASDKNNQYSRCEIVTE